MFNHVVRKCKGEGAIHLQKRKKDFFKTIRQGATSLSSETIMLGEKRSFVESSNKRTYVTGCSYTTVSTTCAVQGGDVVNISAFISHLDDTTKNRLERMNQRLRQLEMQMEAIEAEITKASEE